VEFISALHRSWPSLPVIVIAEKRFVALHALAGAMDRMVLIESQADWRDLLAEKAWMLLSDASDIKPELDVEIRVKTDRLCTWSMRQHGRITADTFSDKELFIDPAKFEAVSEMRSPRDDENFKVWSDKLARKVHEMLFQGAADQLTFHGHFVDTTARVAPERTRVRICSESDTHHDMHFDLLKRLLDDPKPMMLQSSVVRQHGSRRSLQSLYFPPTKLRCLVVLARGVELTIKDPATGAVLFPGLKAAAFEARDVAKALRASAAYPGSSIAMEKEVATGLEVPAVRLLDFKEGDDVLARFGEALKAGPWHLVHFVGHGRTVPRADGAGPGQRGELILCAKDRVTIDFETLALQLKERDTRLMFLSACQTGQGAFLSSAAYHMVPAIIGYRWPIQDARAREFARVFYDALLHPDRPTRHSVERAFVAARASVYESFPAECSWASPALLHQIDA